VEWESGTMRRVLVLADDLTGALESGVLLEGAAVSLHAAPEGEAVVIDTETRHAEAAQARRIIEAWIKQIPAELIYKKTDSTLRGNIGAELAALPGGRIHYAPAYPRLGRTVRDGRLFVNGTPVEETAFAGDPLNPVLDGRIRHLLAPGGAPLERIVIHEGECERDLERAASAVLEEPVPRLAAGPAGLLRVLAARLGLEKRPVPLPGVPECLVINGSAHPVSREQMESAEQAGVFRRGWRKAALDDELERAPALIVFGGDTARAVLRRFGDPLLYPLAEVLPGAVASRFFRQGNSHLLITKAGGFGPRDFLIRIAGILRPASP
jgi:uncharacterized protein YgbK (DUF1537 family)